MEGYFGIDDLIWQIDGKNHVIGLVNVNGSVNSFKGNSLQS